VREGDGGLPHFPLKEDDIMPHEVKRKVRKLRHWKQRWNKNAEFIWRRPVVFGGVMQNPGDLIPESLKANPRKLRLFWESQRIELADFEAPNVSTGIVEAPPAPPVEVMLTASSVLDDEYEFSSEFRINSHIEGEVIPVQDIVDAAFENSGLTMEEWNALPDDERGALIAQSLDWMTDQGEIDPLE